MELSPKGGSETETVSSDAVEGYEDLYDEGRACALMQKLLIYSSKCSNIAFGGENHDYF